MPIPAPTVSHGHSNCPQPTGDTEPALWDNEPPLSPEWDQPVPDEDVELSLCPGGTQSCPRWEH